MLNRISRSGDLPYPEHGLPAMPALMRSTCILSKMPSIHLFVVIVVAVAVEKKK